MYEISIAYGQVERFKRICSIEEKLTNCLEQLIPNYRLLFLLTKHTSGTNTCNFKRWNNRMFYSVKQPLAAIRFIETVINRRFLKKDKSKKVGKIHQN